MAVLNPVSWEINMGTEWGGKRLGAFQKTKSQSSLCEYI